jgi:3-oxoadipate enol-lactonase
MKNSNITCLVLLLAVVGVAEGQTSSPSKAPGAFVDVDGGKLYYEECGSGDDIVVLLHDGVANSAVWDDVWPAFCERFHAIRYDRRGYGRSPATTKPYYEADDLAALLRARKVTHAALVASSHGGEVALDFTLRYTTNVSHLVLIGPAATGFPYSEWFLMLQRAEMQSNKVEDLIAASTRSAYLIAPGHDAARRRLHDLLAKSPQDLTHGDMPLPEKPNFPYVQGLRMPTLILVGSSDAADNQAVAGALVMAIPQAVRVVVPDTGHLMYLEKPSEFFSMVSSFLYAHGL